jgi:DNA-binding transcriptional regulator YiaG
MAKIRTFRQLIELWGTREALAAEIGAQAATVSKWWQRDSVPASQWANLLATETAFRARLRADTLVELAARENAD